MVGKRNSAPEMTEEQMAAAAAESEAAARQETGEGSADEAVESRETVEETGGTEDTEQVIAELLPLELDHIILVSPGGILYKLSVSDHGNLRVEFQSRRPEPEDEDDAEEV